MQHEDKKMDSASDVFERVAGVLRSEDSGGMTPLQLYAWLKRAQAAAEAVMAGLKAKANEEFDALVAKSPTNKAWPVGDFALVSLYGPPGTWIYPKDLIRAEAELKNAKETAKQDGTAKRIDPPQDPTAVAFKVQLLKI